MSNCHGICSRFKKESHFDFLKFKYCTSCRYNILKSIFGIKCPCCNRLYKNKPSNNRHRRELEARAITQRSPQFGRKVKENKIEN